MAEEEWRRYQAFGAAYMEKETEAKDDAMCMQTQMLEGVLTPHLTLALLRLRCPRGDESGAF